MKLSSLLHPALVKCGMVATSKQEALAELVRLLVATQSNLSEPELLQALAEREKLGPFSMGKGVAFPHARTEKVSDFTIVLGTSPQGVDFRAPDGHRVKVAILFVIPKKHSNLYLQALAAFLNVLSVEANLQRVAEAKTPQEIMGILDTLSGRPREAAPLESNGVASIVTGTPLAKAIEALIAARVDALPVVDPEGNLVGEIGAGTILQLGVKEHLLALASSASLQGGLGLEQALRQHADTPVEAIPGLVSPNGFKTVQEDESTLDVAVRLARGGGRGIYVLRGRKLVGIVTAHDLLRKLGR
ncbi:MAG: PTS sugar transporter subunit IIA [Planctomycetes bacterium]|nr:PTS sugar transporter subunit IIA [Planctomycetota bacterium]